MRRVAAVVLCAAALSMGVAACGSETSGVPKCKPHATHCRETSDGAWIPAVYWPLLVQQQRLSPGSTPSYQSSIPSSSAPSSPGISPSEEESPPPEEAVPEEPVEPAPEVEVEPTDP